MPEIELEDAEESTQDMINLISEIEENWDRAIDADTNEELPMNVKKTIYPMKLGVRNNRDQVCCNSSHKRNGLGKSSLSYWQARFNEPKRFQIDRNFFFRGGLKEIKEKSISLPKYSMIVIDEAIRILYKRRSTSVESVDFVEWLGADQRKTDQILIGNIPDFWDLDIYLRMGKIAYLIEILERGIGAMFVADDFPKVDPWHEKEFEDIIKKRKHGAKENPLDKLRLLKQHFCYKCPVFWADFPKDDKEEYLNLVKHYTGVKEDVDLKQDEETQEMLKWRTGIALVRAIKLITARGISRTSVLKEIGIGEHEYKKYYDLELRQRETDQMKQFKEIITQPLKAN